MNLRPSGYESKAAQLIVNILHWILTIYSTNIPQRPVLVSTGFKWFQSVTHNASMSLIIKHSSRWWYGLFSANGRRKSVNLGVKIGGRRPDSLTQTGDDEFERSRGAAQVEYARRQREFEADRTGERALKKLAELKSGRPVAFPRLTELSQHWAQIPRRKVPNDRYATQCRMRLEAFARFVAVHQRDATEFVSVKAATAKAFMAAEEARGVSPKTWNDTLKLLRATFKHLHPQLNDGSNPFHGLVTKATETVNREPFTVEELKAILDACTGDDFVRPLIITGMCTAMRRGDCCLLKWDDVDLAAGFITVKTAKTGQTVDIPIFPLLFEELKKLPGNGDGFCFPEAAAMYRNNPDGITWRVKQVLAKALETGRESNALPVETAETVRARGLAYLDRLGATSKAGNMRAVFTAYLDGQTLDQVMAATGCSRGSVSGYLNELERETGCPIVRGKRRALKTDGLQTERENGKRRASVHDFHSFRITWITLALAAGVPMELVQRVTGHRTVQVVMKHYFRPGREDFRQVLMAAMPRMLSDGGQKSAREQMRAIVEGMTAKTWKQDKARLLELLAASTI